MEFFVFGVLLPIELILGLNSSRATQLLHVLVAVDETRAIFVFFENWYSDIEIRFDEIRGKLIMLFAYFLIYSFLAQFDII